MPPLDQITYRLYRLRRLWLVGSLLPLVGLGFAFLTGDVPRFAHPALYALWPLSLGALIARFPRAVVELTDLALAATLMTAALPSLTAVTGAGAIGATPAATVALLLLVLSIGFVMFLALTIAHGALNGSGPRPTQRTRTVMNSRLDANHVFDNIALHPGSTNTLRRTGPADENGFFDVFMVIPGQPDDPAATCKPDYRACIIASGPLWQNILINDASMTGDTSAYRLEVTPRNTGCTLITAEVHSHLTLAQSLDYWLTDYGRDHNRANLDLLTGHAPRALRTIAPDSPLAWLGRHMPQAPRDTSL